jgi:glycosyltransferase involved in cell wall biosynthesis
MAEPMEGRRVLITTDAVGGVWTYSLDLVRELGTHGVHTTLAVLGPPPEAARLAAAKALANASVTLTGLPLDWLAADSSEVLAASRQIAGLARAQRCDLVHLHTPALAAAGGFAQPVVSVHHSCLATWWPAVRPGENLPEDFRWRTELVARGMAQSDAVVAPTTAHGHAVADAYGRDTVPITIRNGRQGPALDGLADVTQREPFVLTSGRLWDEGKNAATLDRAAGRLGIPFLAAGPLQGPSGTATAFRHLSAMGAVGEEDMRHWLAGAPVYASAARYEPFGLGVLEAAQAGCALVLADIASFRELWAGACLFVEACDDTGFAAAIARLLDDPALLRRMSHRAMSRARHYSAQAMAAETTRLHAGLLALERAGRGAAA